MAALIDSFSNNNNTGMTVLFWNTFNSVDFDDEINGVSYRDLPRPYHRYFIEPCQPER